ncbi:subtilase [Stachybotrys elegans]|uniref:Subtilase n=1 Tax=Stachybotrys elegans TaxID=80388 RepID=A0A8K0SSF6_9HYPO|nr:subtilase [Stachybotrys elegans]
MLVETIPGAYIIEYEDGRNDDNFRSEAQPQYDMRMRLDFGLFKGASIQLEDGDNAEAAMAQIARLPSVKNVWPVRTMSRPEPAKRHNTTARDFTTRQHFGSDSTPSRRRQVNEPGSGYSPHVMTQVDKVHTEGITGRDITIAVIDTGIDYNHPALGGCFGQGCLVNGGFDLVGDDFDGFNQPMPDDDPMDCEGHGTEVAGIIAAQENEMGLLGVAPGASLTAYRIFGCPGLSGVRTTNEVQLAALNRAYEDGANVIHMYAVGYSGWAGDPLAVAVSRIVDKGVACIVGAGDEGTYGLFDAQAPASGEGVTAVASFINNEIPYPLSVAYYTVDNGSEVSFLYEWSEPARFDGVPRPLWATSLDTNITADACEPLPDDTPNLQDFQVLVREGGCDIRLKAIHLVARGARFFLLYSQTESLEYFDITDLEGIDGVGMVTRSVGETWIAALSSNSQVATRIHSPFDSEVRYVNLPNPDTGGSVSPFSTSGPTFEMHMKPQFGAPGDNVLTTFPTYFGSYLVDSGTSLASAFAAGAFALVAEARQTLEPRLIENLLSSTAKPQLYQYGGQPGYFDWLASPTHQGAGLIQVWDAIHAITILDSPSLSFNDTSNAPGSLNFTLSNTGNQSNNYEFTHVPTRSLYSLDVNAASAAFWPFEYVDGHAQIAFKSVTIEVVSSVPINIDNTRMPLWSGYIAINSSSDISLSMPYIGLTGSLYDAEIVRDARVISTDGFYTVEDPPIPQNTSFVLPPPGTGQDQPIGTYYYPMMLWEQPWGSRLVNVHVVPLTSCPPASTVEVHGFTSIGQLPGFPLSWSYRGYFPILWDGLLGNGNYAPEGRYQLVLSVLRIFGEIGTEEDWVVVKTTPFHIKYDEASG